jgi:glycosyltransferase involved in cell wall biosynthesis
MSPQPFVSVVITNYNYDRYLAGAIESALQQTYRHCEVLVVDDGSTDSSQSIIERYGDRVIPIFQTNNGQAAAFNSGFAASRGELICLLDADDLWLPTKVEQIVAAFQAHAAAAVLYHRVQTITQTGQPQGVPWPPYPVIRGNIVQQVSQTGGWWPFPPSTGLSFSRSFLEQVMPIPTAEYRLCADAYLADLAPFFGAVVGLEQALSLFRLHNANNWSHAENAQRRSLQSHELRVQVLNRVLQTAGIATQVSLHQHWPYQRLQHQLGNGGNLLALSRLALQNPWERRWTSRLKTIAQLWLSPRLFSHL